MGLPYSKHGTPGLLYESRHDSCNCKRAVHQSEVWDIHICVYILYIYRYIIIISYIYIYIYAYMYIYIYI